MALHRLTDEGFSDAKVLALMRLYDETCLALCEGQFMDIWTTEHDEWRSVDWYFDMIGRKTAALIAGSAQAGAMLATDDEAIVTAYRRFGWSLGLAFQLNDDLLGIWGDESTTGKETSDIATRKKTLPLIYALQEAQGADRERLDAILRPPGHDPDPRRSRTRCAPSSSASVPAPTRATGPLATVTTRSRRSRRWGSSSARPASGSSSS